MAETLTTSVAAGRRIEVRAADAHRPHVALSETWQLTGAEAAEVTLNGLLISGAELRVSGDLRRVRLRHCTLVPGLTLSGDGMLQSPSTPSLVIESPDTVVEIENCIIGGIRAVEGTEVRIAESIVDATAATEVAYAALDGQAAGGPLHIERSTIIGKVHTVLMELASNTIFLAQLTGDDAWPAPVHADKQQQGCVRFSIIPEGSQTPRRFRCQPDLAVQQTTSPFQQARLRTRITPAFTARQYGEPGYGQLSLTCPEEIRTGAEDGSEMGALSHLRQPQREAN